MTSSCTLLQSLIGTLFIIVLNLNVSFSIENGSSGDIIVEVKQGKLLGSTLRSRMGKEYFVFKGIPYAEVVARFEPAIPAANWEGIKDAKTFGPVCPQVNPVSQKVIGEENCLVLNIYSPKPKLNEKFPVIVFIHGGAFQFGSANDYGGAFIVDEEIILVTINYRLNGFLSTGDEVIQGNMGLKDQSMALRWIQDNIDSFSGDRNRVTLTGTSAGAASVSFQILSPMSKELFQRAITTSGSALNSWSIHPNPKATAQELAEHLDCPQQPSSVLAECLRKTNFRKIVQIKLAKWYVDPLTQYAPVVEVLRPGQNNSSDVFITEDPLILLTEGRFNKVPLITGVMEDEGLLFHAAAILKNAELQKTMNEDWNYVAPITLLYDSTPNATEQQLMEISRTIRGYYFGQRTIGAESLKNLTNLYSDRYFNHGVKLAALIQAKYTPVYPFIFGYHGEWSILNLYYGNTFKKPLGVSHGDDMQYFFDSPRFPNLMMKSEDFSKAIVKLWAAFAKTGCYVVKCVIRHVMEAMGSPKVVYWMPVSREEIRRKKLKWYCLDIQPKVIVREPFTERLEFWDKINAQLKSFSNSTNLKNDSSHKEEL